MIGESGKVRNHGKGTEQGSISLKGDIRPLYFGQGPRYFPDMVLLICMAGWSLVFTVVVVEPSNLSPLKFILPEVSIVPSFILHSMAYVTVSPDTFWSFILHSWFCALGCGTASFLVMHCFTIVGGMLLGM